jgi:hypothetical protein
LEHKPEQFEADIALKNKGFVDGKKATSRMDLLLRRYESELRHPLRNAVTGHLPRALWERVQNGVDLEHSTVTGMIVVGRQCTEEKGGVWAHTLIRFGTGRFTTVEEVALADDQPLRRVVQLREMSPLWEMVQGWASIAFNGSCTEWRCIRRSPRWVCCERLWTQLAGVEEGHVCKAPKLCAWLRAADAPAVEAAVDGYCLWCRRLTANGSRVPASVHCMGWLRYWDRHGFVLT